MGERLALRVNSKKKLVKSFLLPYFSKYEEKMVKKLDNKRSIIMLDARKLQ